MSRKTESKKAARVLREVFEMQTVRKDKK